MDNTFKWNIFWRYNSYPWCSKVHLTVTRSGWVPDENHHLLHVRDNGTITPFSHWLRWSVRGSFKLKRAEIGEFGNKIKKNATGTTVTVMINRKLRQTPIGANAQKPPDWLIRSYWLIMGARSIFCYVDPKFIWFPIISLEVIGGGFPLLLSAQQPAGFSSYLTARRPGRVPRCHVGLEERLGHSPIRPIMICTTLQHELEL